MQEFVYTARTRSGSPVEGRIAAASSALAVGKLRSQGLEVERIRPATTPSGPGAGGTSFAATAAREVIYPVVSGIPLRDAAMFYRQLATLIGAGLPLFQALASCEAQTRNGRLRAILRDCQSHILAGGRLSEALERHHYAFSDLQLAMIRAAEYAGSLESAMVRLATYLENELALRRTISRATLYPKLVAFSALFILGKSFLTDGMPAFSKLIIGSMGRSTYTSADYLMDTAFVLAVVAAWAVAGMVLGRTVLYRSPAARRLVETIKHAIPGVGSVSRGFALTRFARAFSALYGAGLPMSTAIRAAADASASPKVMEGADRALEAVERGESLSCAFARTGALSPMVLDMLRTGEQTGNLDYMMDKVAEHMEGEAETRAFQYAHVFATVVYLAVAFMVGMAIVRFYAGYASGLGG